MKQLKFLIEIERERWALMAAVKLLLRERERELANTTVIVANTKAARVGEWTEKERERVVEVEHEQHIVHCCCSLFLFYYAASLC